MSFEVPIEYVDTTTEENAAILLLGRSMLETLRGSKYTERVEQLRKELEEERSTTERFRQALGSLHNGLTESVDDVVGRCFTTLKGQVEELSRNLLQSDKAAREAALTAVSQERSAIERRVVGIGELLDRMTDLSGRMDTSRLTSSARGRDNETNSRQLIIDAFGTPGSGFTMHHREDFAGDQIFDWNGLRLMWEDKRYTTTVPKAEVDKAWRDFDANQDCHVLLFVSAHSPIQGRESSSGIVSEVREGRLMLYLSCFKNNLDQVGYVKTVVQTILLATKPLLLMQQELGPEAVDERLRVGVTVLGTLSQSLHDQEKACDKLLADMRVSVASMKNGLDRTRKGIDSLARELLPSEAAVSEPTKTVRKCSKCGQPGHTIRSCKA